MSRVLVVTAVDIEVRGLARHLGLERRGGFAGLRYGSAALDVACAGPRALHLDRLADLARTASLVVSAGTCGALAPHLREGDLVIPDTVLGPGGRHHALPMCSRPSQAGALLSVDRVVETARGKARLWQDTAALAVDMESATIVAWAAAMGLPAIAIRGVSDTAAHGVPAALAGVVDGDGRTRASHAVRAVCRRPGTLVRALALRRGTAAALRSVAAALRDLVAARAQVGRARGAHDATRTGA